MKQLMKISSQWHWFETTILRLQLSNLKPITSNSKFEVQIQVLSESNRALHWMWIFKPKTHLKILLHEHSLAVSARGRLLSLDPALNSEAVGVHILELDPWPEKNPSPIIYLSTTQIAPDISQTFSIVCHNSTNFIECPNSVIKGFGPVVWASPSSWFQRYPSYFTSGQAQKSQGVCGLQTWGWVVNFWSTRGLPPQTQIFFYCGTCHFLCACRESVLSVLIRWQNSKLSSHNLWH